MSMLRGKTERETVELNGWGVGTVLRGHEDWANGKGCWDTIVITGLGEETLLGRTIKHERTERGRIVHSKDERSHEHTYTLRGRDWREVAPPHDAEMAAARDVQGVHVGGCNDRCQGDSHFLEVWTGNDPRLHRDGPTTQPRTPAGSTEEES